MPRMSLALAALIAAAAPALAAPAIAAPAVAEDVSPFAGVWQVVPARRAGGPPPDDGRLQRPGPPRDAGPSLPADLAAMLDRGDRRIWGRMTAQGRAMFSTFDPKALPANNCRSPGLPSIAMTPNLQAWTVTPGKLTIHHEYFDTRREIDLTAAPAADRRPADLGHATGTVEPDQVTIETHGFTPAWSGLGRNAPASDAKLVHETYRLVDHDTLSGQILIEDAKYLTEPIRLSVTLRRAKPGTEIVSFPCDLEASRRDVGG